MLLALGALERKGFEPDLPVVQRACKYLDGQAKLRIPSSLDRRVKAALSAGSAAALVAINCDRGNENLNRMFEEAIGRAGDIHSSPQLGWPGYLNLAIVSRQLGWVSWTRFHNATKYFAISICEPGGAVDERMSEMADPFPFEDWVDSEVWRTAHLAIALSLQSNMLEKSLAIVQQDGVSIRDHLGEVYVPPISEDEAAERAKRAAELTRMILEQLKESGMDVDESDLKPKSKKPNKPQ